MAGKRISDLKLEQLLRDGNGVSQIARKLGVTKGAVSKRLKALNVAITKDVTLRHAGEIVERRIDTLGQLQKINDQANSLLDRAMMVVRGELVADPQASEAPQDTALKAMKEVRGQLSLQLDIYKTLFDSESIQQFQQEVLSAIGEVSNDVREKIIQRLREKRAIRSLARFD